MESVKTCPAASAKLDGSDDNGDEADNANDRYRRVDGRPVAIESLRVSRQRERHEHAFSSPLSIEVWARARVGAQNKGRARARVGAKVKGRPH